MSGLALYIWVQWDPYFLATAASPSPGCQHLCVPPPHTQFNEDYRIHRVYERTGERDTLRRHTLYYTYL